MEKASDQDQIHEWLVLLKNNINELISETDQLVKAALEGKLGVRADVSQATRATSARSLMASTRPSNRWSSR